MRCQPEEEIGGVYSPQRAGTGGGKHFSHPGDGFYPQHIQRVPANFRADGANLVQATLIEQRLNYLWEEAQHTPLRLPNMAWLS